MSRQILFFEVIKVNNSKMHMYIIFYGIIFVPFPAVPNIMEFNFLANSYQQKIALLVVAW